MFNSTQAWLKARIAIWNMLDAQYRAFGFDTRRGEIRAEINRMSKLDHIAYMRGSGYVWNEQAQLWVKDNE